jgi:membrane-bound lytic murein transglycosylase D
MRGSFSVNDARIGFFDPIAGKVDKEVYTGYSKPMLLKEFCMTRCFVVLASLLFLLFSGLPYTPAALARPVTTATDPFVIPAGLKPAVEFWKAIFLDYDSDQLVFFDPRNMSKIHQVVEIKQGAGTRRVVRSVRARLVRRGIPSHRIKVQRGISERFEAGVRRSGRYMAHMRKIFSARGLPVELAYLPLVESSFRNDARSFRGAVGMWQFMPSTGRLYMRVTRLVDERRDPMEATRAAARLLQDNYRELGTWPLAVTAYNHGRAGMRRAVRRLGTRDIVTIIRRYRGRTFKFASKNFYAEFLAAVHVMRDLERHLPHVRFDQLVRHEEISLTKRVAVSSLLRHSRVSRAELLTWNPALSRHAAWMPAGYRLKAPELQSQWLRKALAGIGPMPSFPHHVVSRGDTLSELAKVYRTSARAIQSMNGLRSVHRLRVGQRLEIPSKSLARRSVKRQPVRVVERPRTDSGSHHVVSRGDTLWDIARFYGTSARAIQSVNNLASVRRLRPGQRLAIPGGPSSSRSLKRVVKKPRVYHRVRRGETLSTIADRYRVSPAALQRANSIRNRHRIRAGQRLRIPGTQS